MLAFFIEECFDNDKEVKDLIFVLSSIFYNLCKISREYAQSC